MEQQAGPAASDEGQVWPRNHRDGSEGENTETGARSALSSGDGGDAGGREFGASGGQDGLPGIFQMGQEEVGRRLADLQLLRGRSQWLLASPGANQAGNKEPGGGAQGNGPRRQEAKDRSARQLSAHRGFGTLPEGQPQGLQGGGSAGRRTGRRTRPDSP